MLLNCGVGEDAWESLGLQGDQTNQSWRKSVLNIHWKDWCWSWNSNTLATWCEEPTHWKRPWCWERLKAGGEGDDRVWDGWMASLIQWTWVWIGSRSWWWTGRPGVLRFMGSQRVGRDWATELNWTEQWTTGLDRNSEMINLLKEIIGSFLEVQGLELNAFTAMAWVQSLAEELSSRKPCGIAKKGEKKKKKRNWKSFHHFGGGKDLSETKSTNHVVGRNLRWLPGIFLEF